MMKRQYRDATAEFEAALRLRPDDKELQYDFNFANGLR